MRSLFFSILIITLTNSYCQDTTKIPTIEISLSGNYLLNKNTEFRSSLGFGTSIKRIWLSDKRLNLVSGLLFDNTKYFDDYVEGGHYFHYKDMKYNIYSFSIPFLLRVNAKKKYNLFIETGPEFVITPYMYRKGKKNIYFPYSNTSETIVSGNVDHELTDFRINIGFGVSHSIKGHRIIVSSTYHSGIFLNNEKRVNKTEEYYSVNIGLIFAN